MPRAPSDFVKWMAAAWRVLVFVVVGIVCNFVAAQTSGDLMSLWFGETRHLAAERYYDAGLYLAVLFCQIAFCVTIHELGHAAAAKFVGWRVYIVTVGPISYFPAERRIAWAKRVHPMGDVGGWVFAAPFDDRSKTQRTLFALGGSAANLTFAAVGLFVWRFSDRFPMWMWSSDIGWLNAHHFWVWVPRDTLMFFGVAVDSAALGIANLIPIWGEGWRSDGATIFGLALRRYIPPQNWHLILLLSLARLGVRPAYWGARLIHEIENFEGTEEQNLLRDHLLLDHYYALGDVGKARLIIERVIRLPGQKSPAALIAYAFLLAIVDGNGIEAQKALDEVPTERRTSFAYWRAMAITRYVLGDVQGAREAFKNAVASARREKGRPDRDDRALVIAIKKGLPLPKLVPRVAPA
jgi:hypothetical protein